jgi:DNA-directed RNA polymerase specialized sigma24 family protein
MAVFLVLARHHGSIRWRESLSGWLYGVAYRTAMKAKRGAARRRNHEARLRNRTPPAAPARTWDDVQGVLDEEIQRLPESLRSAFVPCILDGKTVATAAAELGVKEGTLSWRCWQRSL